MSRRGVKSIYLNPGEGQLIEAETLEEAIEQHPEVTTVCLFWTWEQHYYTSNAGPFEAYVAENTLDEEYSIQRDRESALEFARAYDCWDGEDFVLLRISDGYCLYGYREEYDPQRSWNDGYDHISGLGDGKDPSWFCSIRVDFDYATGTEYLLNPDPFDAKLMKGGNN